MKIFIDSAILSEIELAYSAGLADGVTTNPSLMKKAVDKLKQSSHAPGTSDIELSAYIEKILLTAKGTPVSLEVTEVTCDKMVDEAKKLFARFNPVAHNVCIKVPINTKFSGSSVGCSHFDAIKAVKILSDSGIPVNCTLIFTPEQALLAAKAGAKYVSPFAGRIDDHLRDALGDKYHKADYFPAEGIKHENTDVALHDNGIVSGVDLIKQTVAILRQYNFKTEVIAASIRNARQAREAALAGADIATLPFNVIQELLYHHKTEEGMKIFSSESIPEYQDLVKK